MKSLIAYANALDSRWRAKNYDADYLPELAIEENERSGLVRSLDWMEISQWLAKSSFITHQRNINSTFGEPEVTLFYGPRFVVEAIFWLDGTTAIHQHSFSGAFFVLEGSSIHCTYDFRTTQRINSHFELGQLRLGNAELLDRGAARPIHRGRKLVHSLFHLDRPSVTIVVRDYGPTDSGPQFDFIRPGIGRDSFYRDAHLTRLMQVCNVLRRIDSPRYVDTVLHALTRLDIHQAFLLIEHLFDNDPNDRSRLDSFIQRAGEIHPHCLGIMRDALDELRRLHFILDRRKTVSDPDLRYFLALILNIPSRTRIFDLVRQRAPHVPPKTTLTTWIRELAPKGSAEAPFFGVELGEAELQLIERLVDGLSTQHAIADLASHYDGVSDSYAEFSELAEAVRGSPLFKHLVQ